MSGRITIDLGSKTAPFEQIKRSILGLVADGHLPVGHRLPPIRQLAGDLGVAPNTVARAYRELEAADVVRSRGRRGTVMLDPPAATESSAVTDALASAVATARDAGLTTSEILAVLLGDESGPEAAPA